MLTCSIGTQLPTCENYPEPVFENYARTPPFSMGNENGNRF